MMPFTKLTRAAVLEVIFVLFWLLLPVTALTGPLKVHRVDWHLPVDQRLTSAHPKAATNGIPVEGFTPLVVEIMTDARRSNLEFFHALEPSLAGSVLAGAPTSTYVIALFDTGSIAHLTAFCDAQYLGLTGPLLTENAAPVLGAGGIIELLVSQPIGVFVDGLDAINPETSQLDIAGLVGHSNVAVLAAPSEDCTDGSESPTVIGNHLSAFYTTVIRNDQPMSLQLDGILYETPTVAFYEPGDVNIPTYRFRVPLELRPPAIDAGYLPTINFETFEGEPVLPTTLIGDRVGSHFFTGVRLSHDNHATQQSFLVDTGAQITVMSSFTAGLLGIDSQTPDFTIDIEGVGGTTTDVPGFIIERLEITTFGDALTLQAVPIVLFDLQSAEGGALDGIIGTNLFADRNLVFAGDLATPFMDISEPIVTTEPAN